MYKIERMPHSLEIGYVGEKNFRPVEIDMTAWMEKMPEGVPSIVCIRPGETKDDAYIAVTTFEDNILTWVPSDADLGVMEGEGMIQVWLEEEENSSVTKRGKSIEVITKVKDSVSNPSADTPAPQTSFLEQMTELKTASVNAKTAAETAQGKAEDAQEDAEDAAEDAEAYAKGTRDGSAVTSEDPAYHNNAKYYAEQAGTSATSAGTSATNAGTAKENAEAYAVGTRNGTPVTSGDPAYHNNAKYYAEQVDPTSIIDDTAGEGQTGKTWSADKLDEEFGDVLNDIQSMQPAATNADIGKALLVKTVADGKPTSWEYGAAGGGSVDPSVIAEAVEDWCDENITSDPTVVIDTSLLVSGAAADSKAVGLKVKHNDDELKMQSSIDDLLAIATKYNDKKIDESGAMVSGGNFDTYEVAYDGTYTTFSATLYSNTNYNTRAISFINSSSQVISVLQYPSPSNSDPQEFINQTIPSGTAKILICNKFKINEPLVTYPTTHSKRLSDIETINSVAGDALNRLNRNLLDETKLISGKGLNDSGEAAAVTGRELTDFIPVEASTFYVYQNAEADYSKVKIAFYTAADEETFINGSIVTQFKKPIKSPVTAQYCRIADGYEVTRQQFEKGEIKTDYHPYNYGTMVQENVIEDKIDIILPERLYAVANQEMNLYFANILEKDWTKYEIECECGNAAQLTRRLVWNNQAVEREFGIKVTKDKTTAERILELKITDASAMTHKSVLIIGDSTTSSNTVVEKLHADINNESLIDTVGTQGTAPYNHEGRSGWSISSYCSNTTGNPFWNPTSEKFDASYYFTQNNISYPDFFIIALGINDIFQMSESQFDARLEMLDGMVSSVKEASSNIGVCLSLVLPPHDQDSFGIDYPAKYKNAITQYRRRWAKWNRMLIDNYDHRESEGIYVIPINMNLDTVYGMNRTEQFVNARSAIKEMRSSSGSGVHPIDSGYWQIADVYWAFLCYMSSLET